MLMDWLVLVVGTRFNVYATGDKVFAFERSHDIVQVTNGA